MNEIPRIYDYFSFFIDNYPIFAVRRLDWSDDSVYYIGLIGFYVIVPKSK